jgi:hypothetical protein
MKIIGILSFALGVYLFIYERFINEVAFIATESRSLRFARLFNQMGLVLIGLMLMIFFPWSCE